MHDVCDWSSSTCLVCGGSWLGMQKLTAHGIPYDLVHVGIYTPRCVEIKCQLDATEVFIADLIACSTCFGHHYANHRELKSIIQWLLPVVFHAVVFKLLVWCGAEGYVSGLQDAAAHNPQLHTRPATWKPQHEIPQAATTVWYSWAPDDGHSGARNMLSKQ